MSSSGGRRCGRADDERLPGSRAALGLADCRFRRAGVRRRDRLARHADVIDGRHEHQEAARHGDVRRDARAFLSERLLDDLDQDFLAFLQQVFDLALGPASSRMAVAAVRRRVSASDGRSLVRRRRRRASGRRPRPGRPSPPKARQLRDRGLVRLIVIVARSRRSNSSTVSTTSETYRNVSRSRRCRRKDRLDPGGLSRPALVHIPDDAALTFALDEISTHLIVLEDRDTRIVRARGDDHLLVHGRNSRNPVNATSPARPSLRRPRRAGGAQRASTRTGRARVSCSNHRTANREPRTASLNS